MNPFSLQGCSTFPCSMKPGQKQIYYMAADSVEGARAAPFVEKLVARGTEVLYLTEAVDEAAITNLAKFGECNCVQRLGSVKDCNESVPTWNEHQASHALMD